MRSKGKGISMKQDDVIVTTARIVLANAPYCVDDLPVTELTFMGMYKSKYVATRSYKYEMEKVQHETVEAFEERFRRVLSENRKLRREMRRYTELHCHPSMLLGLSVGGFSRSQDDELVEYWTFSEGVAALAKSGASIAWSFCDDANGREVQVEIPASFVKLLAKYQFSLRFAIV